MVSLTTTTMTDTTIPTIAPGNCAIDPGILWAGWFMSSVGLPECIRTGKVLWDAARGQAQIASAGMVERVRCNELPDYPPATVAAQLPLTAFGNRAR